MRGFLVAGTASGVGKTTVSLAVIAAMRRRGVVVQAFKGGPDFLDTGHLTRVSGRVARNVDTWMLSEGTNRRLVREAARGADAVVVEGMMGLFDGKDAETERGSSAEIAKLLGLPVVLVLDAGKSARSIAAVVLGFESFDRSLRIAGVVLNRVASERHFRMLEVAIRSACGSPVLGWMPREAGIAISERHLGLRTAEEGSGEAAGAQEDLLAEMAERTMDLDGLLKLECGVRADGSLLPGRLEDGEERVRIGVARDRAFSFYYEDNLDLLREAGAEIVSFSPMEDAGLPEGLDALYLGGGYPELYAERLSGTGAMRAAVREFATAGGVIYAECGGMLYLGRELTTMDGTCYPMAGVLPISSEMTGRLVKFGYVTVTVTEDCLLGTAGTEVRGHSFHCSRIRLGEETGLRTAYRVAYSLSGAGENEGFVVGNVLASYVHLHFGANPAIAGHFVAKVREVRAVRMVRV